LRYVKPSWAAIYHGDTLKHFEALVFPTIGRSPIATITAVELLPLLRKIEACGTLVTAHKVLRASGQVFRYGVATGRRERNRAADLRGALKANNDAEIIDTEAVERFVLTIGQKRFPSP